jgi:hypothetical protein
VAKKMTVEEAMKKVLEAHHEVLTSLQELRMIAKEEGSFIIQDYVKKEDFASAQVVISELDSFTKVDFESNIEQITSSVSSIFGKRKPTVMKPVQPKIKTDIQERSVDLLEEAIEAFKQRSFSIHKTEEHHIEISKDNLHYYFTPIYGDPNAEFYHKVMEEKNELKNIGFICDSKDVLEKAKKYSMEWTEQNKSRCKFLNIRFATIDEVKNTPKVFETVTF